MSFIITDVLIQILQLIIGISPMKDYLELVINASVKY